MHICWSRRSAGDCQNPQPSRPARPRPAALPGAAIRFIPSGLRAETGCQREPTAPLALSASERRDKEQIAPLRAVRRPIQPKQHWDFHQRESRLTTLQVLRYCSGQKKRWFKFPIPHAHRFSDMEQAENRWFKIPIQIRACHACARSIEEPDAARRAAPAAVLVDRRRKMADRYGLANGICRLIFTRRPPAG
jgi:hypothetical protein